MSTPVLKYMPFSSLVDTTFWHILCKKKLDELQLSDEPFAASASFRNGVLLLPIASVLTFDPQIRLKVCRRWSRSTTSPSSSEYCLPACKKELVACVVSYTTTKT